MSSHSMRMEFLQHNRPGPVASVLGTIRAMMAARATRRLLAEMDQHMLADIGIGRGDAITEASRAMWDLRSAHGGR